MNNKYTGKHNVWMNNLDWYTSIIVKIYTTEAPFEIILIFVSGAHTYHLLTIKKTH